VEAPGRVASAVVTGAHDELDRLMPPFNLSGTRGLGIYARERAVQRPALIGPSLRLVGHRRLGTPEAGVAMRCAQR
jgi:hypothetical protein